MCKKTIISLMYFLPISHSKVVFDNFGGKGYGDDPKYIAEYLRKSKANLKLIWMISDRKEKFPKGVKPVKYGGLLAAYHWSTATVWVDNVKNSIKVRKKPEQYYIQTWHSTLGLKKNEADADFLPEKYLKAAKQDAKMTDLMYSNNDFRRRIYETKYWYQGPVLKCSVPRNAVLFSHSIELRKHIFDYFELQEEKKLFLYAPTFRKTRNLKQFVLPYDQLKQALSIKFGGEFAGLIRLHPNDREESTALPYSKDLKNASYYPDMQELLAVCDVLITDYSGCMFDFSFAQKPVFLLTFDLQQYLQHERKLHFSFDELPYSYAVTFEEMLENIKAFQWDTYLQKCQDFFERINLEETGNGAETIGKIIINRCHLYK